MQTATRGSREQGTGPTTIRLRCILCGHRWWLPAHWQGTRIYLDPGLTGRCPHCPGEGVTDQ